MIMKRLTGVTVILAGIGAVAGIFGMSEASAAFECGEGSGFWLRHARSIVLGAAMTALVPAPDRLDLAGRPISRT